jgi:molybdopterin adenylyltransferase
VTDLPPFHVGPPVPSGARALVVTVSDGVANGTRQDESGMALGDRLAMSGFRVDRVTVPDDLGQIQNALRTGAPSHAMVITTGGTGLTLRDVTPQATLSVVDYEVPGLAEAMRAAGRAQTPMADLSRGVVGVFGRTLIVNVPGSPRAAVESLAALEPTLVHALETLAGPFDHNAEGAGHGGRPDLPDPDLYPGEVPPAAIPAAGSSTGEAAPDVLPTEPDLDEQPTYRPGAAPKDPWRDLPEETTR